eukprot:3153655-Rhodomonas_salina.1
MGRMVGRNPPVTQRVVVQNRILSQPDKHKTWQQHALCQHRASHAPRGRRYHRPHHSRASHGHS